MAPTTTPNPVTTNPGKGRRPLLVAGAAVFAVSFAVFVSMGTQDFELGVLASLDRLLVSGATAAAYLAGGVGLGRLMRPLWRGSGDDLALQVVVGLAAMLWLSHLLGWLGAFGGTGGAYVAIGVVAVGVLLAAHQFLLALRGKGLEPAISVFGVISTIGIAILLVAACNPPGALWGSEFGAYDVLEYHLELPQEWLVAGRIAPVAHNVYSYLPSYLEAAYTHLGAMTLAPKAGPDGAGAGLIAGEGYRLMACQFLHAGFTLIAAWLTGRLVRGLSPTSKVGAAFACALVLITPWTIVVGSMAYNEMALVAMLAGSLIAACSANLAPWRRGLLTGLLVGAASSVKPTGLLFAGVPAGIMLLGACKPRDWVKAVVPGALAGLAMLAPWLVRNYLASGNPVFPFAASIFGMGSWTSDQVSRYEAAHSFHGSILDRLRLLVWPDSTPSPNGQSSHRGMLHPQWGIFFPLTLIAMGALLVRRHAAPPAPSRPAEAAEPTTQLNPTALLALGFIAQMALWLFTGHLQSRFLLPLVAPGAAICGLAASRSARGRLTAALFTLPILAQACFSVLIFAAQRSGNPNLQLIPGPSIRTGQIVREMPTAEARKFAQSAPPELFLNIVLPPSATVYLLGSSTPLYLTRHILYHTTYDTWLLRPLDDPSQWSANLRSQGVDYVLVSLGEIARLQRSGWTPPGITLEAVKDWLLKHTVLVQEWEQLGVYLVRPIEPPPQPATAKSEHP